MSRSRRRGYAPRENSMIPTCAWRNRPPEGPRPLILTHGTKRAGEGLPLAKEWVIRRPVQNHPNPPPATSYECNDHAFSILTVVQTEFLLISTGVRVHHAVDPRSIELEVRLGDEARTGLPTLAISYKSYGYAV